MRRKNSNGKAVGILAILLILAVSINAAEAELTDDSGQWKYTVEPSTGLTFITGYVGEPPEDLVFPSKLDGRPVYGISEWTDTDVYLTSVTIPDGIQSIGQRAFSYYCYGFTSITIPDSVAIIGDWAFYCCDLTSVTIPAGVETIYGNPFDACPLETIEVAAGNKVFEQVDGVLFNKQAKALVVYPGARKDNPYTIPRGTLRIGTMAFTNCNGLKGVVIPDSVTSIDDMAFWGCTNLTDVTIPDSVTSIGEMAFSACDSLARVTIPASVTRIGEEAFGWGRESEAVLHVEAGSYAAQYARDHEYRYVQYTNGAPEDPDDDWYDDEWDDDWYDDDWDDEWDDDDWYDDWDDDDGWWFDDDDWFDDDWTEIYPGMFMDGWTAEDAYLNQRMATRTGPGSNYTEDHGTLPESTEIVVYAKEESGSTLWALVEFVRDGKLVRAYTGMKRVDADEYSIRQTTKTPKEAVVAREAQAYYGPDSTYLEVPDLVTSGMEVQVYGVDRDYALIDYAVSSGQRTRSWVPVSCIEFK